MHDNNTEKKGQEHQILFVISMCDTFLVVLFSFCLPRSLHRNCRAKLLHDAIIEFRMNIIYFFQLFDYVCVCVPSLAYIFALVLVVCYFNELIGF